MLGGGVWVTQNKTLPGSYINIVTAAKASANLGERGIVAIALPLNKAVGTVIELNRADFMTTAKAKTGKEYNSADLLPIREIFQNATKVYVYDLGTSTGAKTVTDALDAFEPYEFNVLCAYTSTADDITSYVNKVKSWRDDAGKKCQLVVYNQTTSPDHEGIINVVSTVAEASAQTTPANAYELVAWVAGAEAGCNINQSITNKKYNGELTVLTPKTQTQLATCLTSGQFVFHLSYGDVCVLEDINSLTTTSTDKGGDFKYNQTIRVIDQIANDIAKLFNTKYLGKIPNNASGRVSLWADIVAHHRELETMQAIEDFDPTLVTVEQGDKKKAVVVNDAIKVTNAMAILYMTVVVQ